MVASGLHPPRPCWRVSLTYTWLQRLFSGSMRRVLLWIVVVVIVLPLLAVQAGIYRWWFNSRQEHELQENLEIARAVGGAFENFVRDVRRDEAATGAALAGLKPYTPEQANRFLAGNAHLYPAVRRWHWITPQGRVLASSDTDTVGQTFAGLGADFQRAGRARLGDQRSPPSAQQDGGAVFFVACQIPKTGEQPESIVVTEIASDLLGEMALPMVRRGRRGLRVVRSPGDDGVHPAERADGSIPAGAKRTTCWIPCCASGRNAPAGASCRSAAASDSAAACPCRKAAGWRGQPAGRHDLGERVPGAVDRRRRRPAGARPFAAGGDRHQQQDHRARAPLAGTRRGDRPRRPFAPD